MRTTSSLSTPLERAQTSSNARAARAAILAWCLLVATDAIVAWGGAPALLKIIRAYPVRRLRASGGPEAADLLDAMRRASIFGIHHYKCLKYWAAATCLLRYYGHPASFVIAVTRHPFQSHAWLEYEGGSAGRDQIPGAQWLVIFRG